YPNPFNPNTTINFTIPKNNSQIKLVVYNVNGQLVSTLFDGVKNVGKHYVIFDASHLNSGVYYYSLDVNGVKEATKKMVMIK
ncbi:MAG: T9SS type A sorting domain-containing protein, partial [Candidatus Delongbacteria bacterium]|nr:T9SS type A sorting domain-containing protein [Candidatus Delongbacteria bacterium]